LDQKKRRNTYLSEGASTFDEADTAEEDEDNEDAAPANEVESEQLPLLIRPTRLLLYVPAPRASPRLRLPLLERAAEGTICK